MENCSEKTESFYEPFFLLVKHINKGKKQVKYILTRQDTLYMQMRSHKIPTPSFCWSIALEFLEYKEKQI